MAWPINLCKQTLLATGKRTSPWAGPTELFILFFSPYISCIEILHPYIRIYSVYPYILSISVCPQYISISLYTHYISKSVYRYISISVYLDILSISSVYQYFNKSVYLVIPSISFSSGGPKETV